MRGVNAGLSLGYKTSVGRPGILSRGIAASLRVFNQIDDFGVRWLIGFAFAAGLLCGLSKPINGSA